MTTTMTPETIRLDRDCTFEAATPAFPRTDEDRHRALRDLRRLAERLDGGTFHGSSDDLLADLESQT